MRCTRAARAIVRSVATAVAAATVALSAEAAEFRSVNVAAALLYDAPALSAARSAILTRYYPVEVISQTSDWVKVRDASGQLLWLESKALSPRRTVLVVVHLAEVRAAPDVNASTVFRAEQQVVLDLLDGGTGAWVKVRHRDGATGYLRAEQLWGL
jgi:SH3-like domain-containing protein